MKAPNIVNSDEIGEIDNSAEYSQNSRGDIRVKGNDTCFENSNTLENNENKKSILSQISQKENSPMKKHQNIISTGVNIFSKNAGDKSTKT